MFKVNNRNTKTRCEICSKLAIKTPEQRHWHRSGVFVVNFWTYFTPCSNISNFDFEQVNASWVTWKISICDDRSDKISSKWFGWGDMYLLYIMETNFFKSNIILSVTVVWSNQMEVTSSIFFPNKSNQV